jgi:Phosphatidylinositol-4-phosphate 5-Kinase
MLDRVISVVAVAQAIYVTLQAGIQLVEQHVLLGGGGGGGDCGSSLTEMDGPRILPETNEALFDLTEAFRYAVKLGLRSDEYQDDPDSFELHFLPSRNSRSPRTPVEPYRMSLTSALTSSSLGVEKLQQEQEQQQQQQQQHQQPEMMIDWCTTLQNGDIIHKSSLDGMDLASLDHDGSASSSMGLPLPSTRRLSSSSLLLPSEPPQHDQSHEDFDVVLTANVPQRPHHHHHPLRTTTTTTTTAGTPPAVVTGTSSSSSAVRVSAYAPAAFATLRHAFGLDERLFHDALLRSGPYVSFQTNSKGSARSNGIFFFTAHGTYLIKTIKSAEADTLLHVLLPKYHHYMTSPNGRSSLINRICGLYRVEMVPLTSRNGTSTNQKTETYTFVVMNSVFPAHVAMDEKYDLKGSTLGRRASSSSSSESVWKDMDLVEQRARRNHDDNDNDDEDDRPHRNNGGLQLVGNGTKEALLAQLKRDVALLRSCALIDYR